MTPLCFIDTETTGVHPDRAVWEIAMIRRDDGGQREQCFFVDVDLEAADPIGLGIGRFYERHPVGRFLSRRSGRRPDEPDDDADFYVSKGEAALRVARFTHGAHLVGAVPNFDAEVLDGLLRAHWLIPGWHYHLIDVESLAVGWLSAAAHFEGGPRVQTSLPWKSDDISLALGVEPPREEERHTAMGDAAWAMRMYGAVTSGQASGVAS